MGSRTRRQASVAWSLALRVVFVFILLAPLPTFAQEVWNASDWTLYDTITIDSADVDDDLTDFPVYVDLSDLSAQFWSTTPAAAATVGTDIRVTTDDGSPVELPRELVAASSTAQTGELHFEADSISSTTDTVFRIYYNGTTTGDYATSSTYGAQNVWGNGYTAVYHSENGGVDSTSNAYDMSANGNAAVVSGGQLGSAFGFDGTGDYYSIATMAAHGGQNTYTISAWSYLNTLGTTDSTDDGAVFAYDQGNTNTDLFWYNVNADGTGDQIYSFNAANTSNATDRVNGVTTPAVSTWHHLTATRNGATRELFFNGASEGTSTGTTGNNPVSAEARIGGWGFASSMDFDGRIDEVRVADAVRSDAWIAAEHTNQSTTTDFYTAAAGNPAQEWNATDWTLYDEITIDATDVDDDLTNFPVYIDLADLSSQFWVNTVDGGTDIRVTTGTSSPYEVPREVVSASTTAETGELYFKAPFISSTTDTVFRIYYNGTTTADYTLGATYGADDVWSENYVAVYHNGAGNYDSTANKITGTAVGGVTAGDTAGLLGEATTYNGSSHYFDLDQPALLDIGAESFSICAWAKFDGNAGGTFDPILSKGDTQYVLKRNGNTIEFKAGGSSDFILSSQTVNTTDYYYICGTTDGNNYEVFVNGTSGGSDTTGTFTTAATDVWIGSNADQPTRFMDGIIDAIRFSSTTHTDAWIAAEYTNQSSSTDFYSVQARDADSGVTISGTLYENNGFTPITTGKMVSVAVGTSAPSVYSTTTDGSGNYSIELPAAYTGANSWSTSTASGDNDNWRGVTYGNGLFVAVDNNNSVIVTSPDGITWTERSTGAAFGTFRDIVYGNGLFVAVGFSNDQIVTSPDGITWTERSTPGFNDALQAVTYGDGRFVAVADFGNRVLTSTDGINWASTTAAGDDDSWRDVAYGKGLFVAVGGLSADDRFMTSPDGTTWTARSVAGDNDSWQGITYGNGKFVAVSASNDRVATSPDGITWTVQNAAGDNDTWRNITYGNGLFVAVGNGPDRVMTSPDGITWTVQNAAGDNDDWNDIAYGNGRFVAVAGGTGDRVMHSEAGFGDSTPLTVYVNGETEDATTLTYGPPVGTSTIPGIDLHEDVVRFQHSSTSGTINLADADFYDAEDDADILFTATTSTTTITGDLIIDDNTTILAPQVLEVSGDFSVGETGSGNPAFAAERGTVNLTGTSQTLNYAGGGEDFHFYDLRKSVSTAANLTVETGATVETRGTLELNGAPGNLLTIRSQTPDTNIFFEPYATATVSYLDLRVISNTSATTTLIDCTLGCVDSGFNSGWEFPPDPVGLNITGALYENDSITPITRTATITAAVGTSTPSLHSTTTAADGSFSIEGIATSSIGEWTNATTISSGDGWQDVTYGNGRFVAVGSTGNIVMTSLDGTTWTARSAAGDDDDWKGVTYGNGVFVAVGDKIPGDRLMTSPDGITWTAGAMETSRNAVTYGNGTFVTVGNSVGNADSVLSSSDGETWTTRTAAGDNENWTDVTYGNGRFVAVADEGDDRVITSPDGITWIARSAAGDDDAWKAVTYGNGTFVAVGHDVVMTSSDGINWATTSALGNDDDWEAVTYGNGQFTAVGFGNGIGGGDTLMYSFDGETWTTQTNPASGSNEVMYGVTYGNGAFSAVGAFGNAIYADAGFGEDTPITLFVDENATTSSSTATTLTYGLNVDAGTATITADLIADTLLLQKTSIGSSSNEIYLSDADFYDAEDDTDILFTATTSTTTVEADLEVASGTTLFAPQNLALDGNFTQNGTFEAERGGLVADAKWGDVLSARYVGIVLDVSGEDTIPTAMLFNDEGTVLYVLGATGDDINAYPLDTAYDISSYTSGTSVALDVSAEEISPVDMIFNNDGTILYIVGFDGDDINAYPLDTAYDISSYTSGTSVALDVSGEELIPQSMLFNDEGTVLYVLGATGDDINAYPLDTAYDISSYTSGTSVALDVSAEEGSPQNMLFNDEGTVLYVLGATGDDINAYPLDTAYDISSYTSGTSVALDVSGEETSPLDLLFNDAGSVLYILGNNGVDINAYTLDDEQYFTGNFSATSSLWDLTVGDTATVSLLTSFAVDGNYTNHGAIERGGGTITLTGTSTLAGDGVLGNVRVSAEATSASERYEVENLTVESGASYIAPTTNLTVSGEYTNEGQATSSSRITFSGGDAYGVANMSRSGESLDISARSTNIESLTFGLGGRKLYVMTAPAASSLYEYDLSTPYDLTTATYTGNSAPPVGSDVHVTPTGDQFIVIADFLGGNDLQAYRATSSYNLDTLETATSSTLVLDESPNGMFVDQSGMRVYVSYFSEIEQYELATPNDLDTATFVASTSVGARDLHLSDDGTRLSLVDWDGFAEFTLSTPWDITTASSTDSIEHASLGTSNVQSMYIAPAANRTFVLDRGTDSVDEFVMGAEHSGTLTGTSALNDVTFVSSSGHSFLASASTSDFTIQSNATVTAPGQLTIGGDFTQNGNFDASGSDVSFKADKATISGDLIGLNSLNNVSLERLSIGTGGIISSIEDLGFAEFEFIISDVESDGEKLFLAISQNDINTGSGAEQWSGIMATDFSGATLWFATSTAFESDYMNLAVDDTNVYRAGTCAGGVECTGVDVSALYIVAYDNDTGAELWSTTTDPGGFDSLNEVASDGGQVYVTGRCRDDCGDVGTFYTAAFDTTTGLEEWTVTTNPGSGNDSATGITVDDEQVYVTGTCASGCGVDSAFYTVAYNPATGAEIWATTTDPGSGSDFAGTIAVDENGLYISGRCSSDCGAGNTIYTVSLDPTSGSELWSATTTLGTSLASPADVILSGNDTIEIIAWYGAGSAVASLYVIRLDTLTGEVLFETDSVADELDGVVYDPRAVAVNGLTYFAFPVNCFVGCEYGGLFSVYPDSYELITNESLYTFASPASTSDLTVGLETVLISSNAISIDGDLQNFNIASSSGVLYLTGAGALLTAQATSSADSRIGDVVVRGSYTSLSTTTVGALTIATGGDLTASVDDLFEVTDIFTIGSGGQFVAPSSGSLLLNSDFIQNGEFDANAGSITFTGQAPSVSGSLTGSNALEDVVTNTSLGWTAQSVANDDDRWRSIVYANDIFVAVGSGGSGRDVVMTSSDGIAWATTSAAGDDDSWNSVVYGGGQFVAVGGSGDDRIMTSPDGINWTAQTSPEASDSWSAVTYGEGLYVAVGRGGGVGLDAATSPDGINWTARSVAGNDDSWEGITYGNGQFVAVGSSLCCGYQPVMTSPDGINWTGYSAAGDDDSWNSVVYGGGQFVAVGGSGDDRIMTSSDGISWATTTDGSGDVGAWRSVIYVNDTETFVAVSTISGDRVMTSSDGISWTTYSALGDNDQWFDLAYGNGQVVAVGGFSLDIVMTASTSDIVVNFLNNASTSNLTIGTSTALNLEDTALTLTGNYTNHGRFIASTSNITFAGTATQTATGTMTGTSQFNDLTIANTSGNGSTTWSVVFGADVTATGTMTMLGSTSAQFAASSTATFQNVDWNGSSTDPIYLGSTVPGEEWFLEIPGSRLNIDYVEVQDSNATNTTEVVAASSTDWGNNTNWDFGATATEWNATDWTLYDTITIKHENIDESLSDFPVYIDLADLSPSFWSTITDDGGDIRVTTDDATPQELPREVVSASTTLETGELHFKADFINKDADTSFRIWYNGNTDGDYATDATYGAENVWANGYVGVWHLNQIPTNAVDEILDSTSFRNHGQSENMGAENTVAGQIGRALSFDGFNDSVDLGSDIVQTDNLTLSAIVNADSFGQLNLGRVFSGEEWLLTLDDTSDRDAVRFATARASVDGNWRTPDNSFTVNETTFIHVTHENRSNDTSDPLMYLDSSLQALTEINPPSGAEVAFQANSYIADQASDDRAYEGFIDELRLSSTTRSAAWIRAEYLNQSTTTDFYALGAGTSGTGSSTISDHDATQTNDAFNFQNVTDGELFAFQLTPETGNATITELTLTLRGVKKIDVSDFSNIRLYKDHDDDAAYDVSDEPVATGLMTLGNRGRAQNEDQIGTIIFTEDFLSTTTQNYLVVADWNAPQNGAFLTIDLEPADIEAFDATGAHTFFGEVDHVQHNRNNQGGGGSSAAVAAPEVVADPPTFGGGNEGGEQIGDDPDFGWPSSHTGSVTNGANAYDQTDGTYATAGTFSTHNYADVGNGVPASDDIVGIEVKLEMNSPGGAQFLNVLLSWDGGTTYTSAKSISPVPSSDTVFSLGGPSDLWGRSWSASEFSDTNFQVQIQTGENGDLNIDAIQVRVYHQATGGSSGGGGAI